MILYFLRHGLAGERDAWQGDDSERPLTKKGIDHMKASVQCFKKMGVKVDCILSSPLKRAVQTARIAAKALDMDIVEDARLGYGFDLNALGQIIAEHPGIQAMMLVGHEPDFSSTVGALCGGGDVLLKKGGMARVELVDGPELKGQLVWLLPPKILVS